MKIIILNTFMFLMISTSIVKSQNLYAKIDSMMLRHQLKHKIPGLVYGISINGNMVHQKALGIADLRHDVPVKLNTVFDLASITKQFIASAILLLEQNGKLNLDDPIANYISDCPEFCHKIKIRQLLNHTSGIVGSWENWEKMEQNWGKEMMYTDEQWLSIFKEDTLRYNPGERFEYSSLGYYLAGLIVKNASGVPSGQFLIDRFFIPLNMINTYIEDEDRITPNESDGYIIRNDSLFSNRRDWDRETVGDGGVFSTVEDMVKWEHSISNCTILSKESVQKLFEFTILNDGSISYYGLGWMLNNIFGIEVQYHRGVTGPIIFRVPARDLFVVVLSNLNSVDAGGFEILQMLIPELSSDKSILKQEIPGHISDYLGNYISLDGTRSSLYLENGRIKYKFGEQYEDELIYYRDDIFLVKDYPAHYEFERNKDGEVNNLLIVEYCTYSSNQKKIE